MKNYFSTIMIAFILIFSIYLFLLGCKKKESPTVTTAEVDSIFLSSANVGGTVTLDGGSAVTARGFLVSFLNTTPTFADYVFKEGEGIGNFSIKLTDLPNNLTYYVRAFASNIEGTSYGNVISFKIGYETVTTAPVTNVTVFTATSGGNVATEFGENVRERGVCWGTKLEPLITGDHTSDGEGPGVYVSVIKGLRGGITYYLRAYAQTYNYETVYGNEISFSTPVDDCNGKIIYEGKAYNMIRIGAQCWLKENLNVGIRLNSSQSQSNDSVIEKYCYDDLESNCTLYGGIYNWNEIMQYDTTPGAKGICPTGWHIPTYFEWYELTEFLGGESVAGGKMKESGTVHWLSPNEGATNSSGFSALPAGTLNEYNHFEGLASGAIFFSSSRYEHYANIISLELSYYYKEASIDHYYFGSHSVRCLRD